MDYFHRYATIRVAILSKPATLHAMREFAPLFARTEKGDQFCLQDATSCFVLG